MSKKLAKILFTCLMMLFALVAIQQALDVVEKERLEGAITEEDPAVLNKNTWFNRSYQGQFEKYHNQNFGLRNWFVRLNNQWQYSFFGIVNSDGGMLGKGGYLYIFEYIKEHYGLNFAGKKSYEEPLDGLYTLKEFCEENNKELLFVYAPNKASFYPEYIPDRYEKSDSLTNYEYVKSQLLENDIDLIDFNQWFIDNKETAEHTLIPKTGTHWSVYGMYLAMDSIINHIEADRAVDLPEVIWDSVRLTRDAHHDDSDIENGMNLIFDIDDGELAYPSVSINDTNKDSLNVLVIGDSFYWGLYNRGMNSKIFRGEDCSFWFYYNDKHPKIEEDYVLYDLLMKQDVIMMIHTSSTTPLLGFGFLQEAAIAIANPSFTKSQLEEKLDEDKIKEAIILIKSNQEWMKEIKVKAKDQGLSIEEMILKDAKWFVDSQR